MSHVETPKLSDLAIALASEKGIPLEDAQAIVFTAAAKVRAAASSPSSTHPSASDVALALAHEHGIPLEAAQSIAQAAAARAAATQGDSAHIRQLAAEALRGR